MASNVNTARVLVLSFCLSAGMTQAFADTAPDALALKFSCSHTVGSAEQQVIYTDIGEISLLGEQIRSFRWESSLHRRTHGFDCSMDESDGLQAKQIEQGWRVSTLDAVAAREKRGYDRPRGRQCSVRLLRDSSNGHELQIIPTCPVLCGSRENFSELRINLQTGQCQYESTP